MSVKFFGQYLVDQGEVDASDLREALAYMDRENATLGEIAVAQGYMRTQDTTLVHAEQRNRDVCFGDLAVEMGMLEPAQLVDLLRRQRSRRLPIGQALVKLGHLASDRLGVLLDAFKTDQAEYQASEMELPDGLACHRVTRYVLELLPRYMMRVARMQAKVGAIEPFAEAPEFVEVRVSIPMKGARGLEIALASDLEFAESLAMAATGLAPVDLDPEMVADGVGEYLNVLCGNAASALSRDGQRVEVGPPDYEAELCDGWTVELAVGTGRAALVLSTF